MGYKEIIQNLIKNACYMAGRKLSRKKGVLIHSTATPGATPERFANNWNVYHSGGKDIGPHKFEPDKSGKCITCGGRQCCVNAFCDDTKVIQTLPYDHRPWGCGSGKKGSGNDWYTQIEICEPAGIYYDKNWNYHIKSGYEDKVKNYIINAFEVAAQWAAARLKEFGITQVNKNTVTSHYEAYANGIAGNHGDPRGLFALAGLDMDKFRVRVDQILNKGDELDMTIEEFIEKATPEQAAAFVNKARKYFRDLEPSNYANEALDFVRDAGIMVGDGSGKQQPRDLTTREQTAVMIKRTLEYLEAKK